MSSAPLQKSIRKAPSYLILSILLQVIEPEKGSYDWACRLSFLLLQNIKMLCLWLSSSNRQVCRHIHLQISAYKVIVPIGADDMPHRIHVGIDSACVSMLLFDWACAARMVMLMLNCSSCTIIKARRTLTSRKKRWRCIPRPPCSSNMQYEQLNGEIPQITRTYFSRKKDTSLVSQN